MSEIIRCFIAIELSQENREQLKRTQDYLRKCACDVKWVHQQNIHMTLRFLGNLREPEFIKASNKFNQLTFAIKPFSFTINSLGAYPRTTSPRVLWAGIGENAKFLIQIAKQVNSEINEIDLPKDDKTFSPHITIGRVRSLKNKNKLASALTNYSFKPPLEQTVNSIILFKSTLTSQGPIYKELTRKKLKQQ